MTDSGSIVETAMIPQTLPEVISEHRENNIPRISVAVPPNQKKKKGKEKGKEKEMMGIEERRRGGEKREEVGRSGKKR